MKPVNNNELTIFNKIESGISLATSDIFKQAWFNLKSGFGKGSGKLLISKNKLKSVVDGGKDFLTTFVAKTDEEKEQYENISEVLKNIISTTNYPEYTIDEILRKRYD